MQILFLYSCSQARGFSTLAALKSLRVLSLPHLLDRLPEAEIAAIAALRDHPSIERLTPHEGALHTLTPGQSPTFPKNKESFWRRWDREAALVAALRKSEFTFSINTRGSHAYGLSLSGQPFSDLSIFKDMPLETLTLEACKVADLSPLRDLPLRALDVSENPVT